MKKILFVLLSSIATITYSQKLTNDQIEKYLTGLKNEQILSEFGKDALYKIMTDEKGNFLSALSQNPTLARGKSAMMMFPDSLSQSKHVILFYIGILDLMRNVGSSADELVQIREGIEKMLGEKMLFRNDIDGDADIKNPLSFLQLSMNLKTSREYYLQVVLAFKKIGLIDERDEKDIFVWLEKEKLFFIKDFSPFIYAAKQSFFYQNYSTLKNEQIRYIDSLKNINLINVEDYKTLINSYSPFELKSNIEILSKLKNAVIVDFNPLNTTRAEIYEKVFAEIKKKMLPDLQYKELILTETTKKNAENPYDFLVKSNPLLGVFNSLKNNTKYFQLSVQIANQRYIQKSETDFTFSNRLKDLFPPNIQIDSSVFKAYMPIIQGFTGFGNSDLQVLNDYLNDIHSNNRIVVVSNGFNPFATQNDSRKVILLLDKSQYSKVFQRTKRNYTFGPFNFGEKSGNEKDITIFNNKDSRDSLRKILYGFQSVNVIPQISESELDKIIVDTRLENKRHNYPRNLLKSYILPLKSMNLGKTQAQDYQFFKNFIADLSTISNGEFNPEKPFDNFEKELKKEITEKRVLVFGFRMGGKKYENESELYTVEKSVLEAQNAELLNMYNSVKSPKTLIAEYIGLANAALVGSNIDGQFYDLADGKIIYLAKHQTEFLQAKYPSVFTEFPQPLPTDYYKEAVSAFDSKILFDALKREKMLEDSLYYENIAKTLREPSEVFKHSADVFVIDMNDYYNKTNVEFYKEILQKISKKVFDGTSVDDITFETDSTSGIESDHAYLLSATFNGKKYNQLLTVSMAEVIKSGVDSLNKTGAMYYPSIGENQFRIVNDYLTDINSKKRLVIVCDYQSPKLSFVFFDSTQAKIVEETLPNNYVDFTMFDRQNSVDSLKMLLNEFKNLKIISDSTNTDRVILDYRKLGGDKLNLLLKSPDLIANLNSWDLDLNTDLISINIGELNRISRGEFNAQNISHNFKQMNKKSKYKIRNYTYEFTLDNKKYSENQVVEAVKRTKKKKFEYDYLEFELHIPALVNLCNKALTDSGRDGAFYQLANFGEDDEIIYSVIYLNNKQYKFLSEKMPSIFAESYDSDEADFDEKKIDK